MFDFLFRKRKPLPMPYRRELHCHILPGLDDGASEIDFSIDYLRFLEANGVERIIFTPHHTHPKFLNTPEETDPVYRKLVTRMQAEGLQMQAEGFSFEYRMDESFFKLLGAGKRGTPECRIRPLRERALLVEGAWQQPVAGIEELVDDLQRDGYEPILAHPERYPYWTKRHDKYDHLQEIGLAFQCNILSFAGYYGDDVRKTALWMLKQGYVNFLGSDLHNRHHVELIEAFLRSRDYAAIRQDLVDSIENDKL